MKVMPTAFMARVVLLPAAVLAWVSVVLMGPSLGQVLAEPPPVATEERSLEAVERSSNPDSQSAPSRRRDAGTQAEPSNGESAPAATRFARIRASKQETPLALETAIVRYVSAEGEFPDARVDLVAAVHIGDAAYYQALNRRFADYDAVLYELVAPVGTVPEERAAGGTNPVSGMQHGLKRLLALEHQIEQIDYRRENFVHADMDPQQLLASMQKRGETVTDLLLRLLAYGIANQGGDGQASDAQLLAALLDRNRAVRLKRIMAAQLVDLEGAAAAIDGPQGSTLIAERNKVALNVLERELKSGKKKLAIFYGAAHLPDMERRLAERFSLEPSNTQWIEAWNLQD